MEEKKNQAELCIVLSLINPPHLPHELVPDKYYEQYKDMPVYFRENVTEENGLRIWKLLPDSILQHITGWR